MWWALFSLFYSFVSGAVVPCTEFEVYYGNYTQIECISITNGTNRLFLDLQDNAIPIPGFECPWLAINNEIWFPGFASLLAEAAVYIDLPTQTSYHTQISPNPPNVLLDWNDILINPLTNLIYGSFDWPINGIDTRQFFYYQNASNATAVSFFNLTLDWCGGGCGIFSASPVSTLDITNNIYYSITQSMLGTTWIITVDFNKNQLLNVSPRSTSLMGLQTLVYNPEDGLLYGYLTWETQTMFYNTSIITVDPKTAQHKVIAMVDLPENMPFSEPNTFSPLLVHLNPQKKVVYALYTTQNITSKCYYHNLKTIDLLTGKILYSVSLGDIEWCPPLPELPEPWGLTSVITF